MFWRRSTQTCQPKSAGDRHILITGTSTGIGRACAIGLARQGFSVWAGVRTASDAASIEEAGMNCAVPIRPLHLDVTDVSSIRAAEQEIRSCVRDLGLFGVINNAGICVVGPVEFVSLEDWRRQFDVNLFGVISVTQTMLPLLRLHNAGRESCGSRVVNMCSITGEVSTPLFGPYSASKFALRALSDSLRLELQSQGIHVCLVVPGTIQSEIWRKEKECVEAIAANSPARKVYGALIDNVAGYVFGCAQKALPAERVSAVVQRCFSVARPKIQYRVGWEAEFGSRARKLIPDRLFDYLLGWTMKVPGRNNGRDPLVEVRTATDAETCTPLGEL